MTSKALPGIEQSHPSAADTLTVKRRGAALWVTLDRPESLNAITPAMAQGLHAALDSAEDDSDVRAVVIAAAGRVFCAGADLGHVQQVGVAPDRDGAELLKLLNSVGQAFTRIEACAKPVIAAVHGLAVAGGLEMVLACDIVVAARSAAFGDAHANYGILPGGGGSARLPRRVGLATAKYLMFTGKSMSAAELADTDLVTLLVEDAELVEAVDGIVDSIAAKSPLGLSRMKRLVADGMCLLLDQALANEIAVVAEHTHSDDFTEGLTAFIEKRRPTFTGR